MLYECDMCGAKVGYDSTKKLLNKRYCIDCISKARKERRERIRKATRKVSKTDRAKQKESLRLKRIEEGKCNTLKGIIDEFSETGLVPIIDPNIPIRLKRNEKVYLLAGRKIRGLMSIALALTNYRLFFVKTEYLLRVYTITKTNSMSFTSGIKTISLSSVIAINTPTPNSNYSSGWKTTLHLDKGKDISIFFNKSRGARLFYVLLAEMVDRLNDPIDQDVFSPNRERIPDHVKVTVWRRDGGSCVRCGSRKNLEYDHIIPVSKGGSNTVRNIELLCEKCNRKKLNRIM